MIKRWLSGIVGMTLISVLTVWSARDSYAANEGYRLGPADIISIVIFAGGEQQVAVDLTISEQGFINFPFIGPVKAGGMTNSDLEKLVYTPLEADYFVNPQVHVRIKEYHSLHFSISGAVKKPGKFEMQATTTIMDIIAKAEGLSQESGKIAYVIRVRNEGKDGGGGTKINSDEASTLEPIKVNLVKLLDEGDMSLNISLIPGDSIYIPHAKGRDQSESKVYVSGEVQKPALYDFQTGLTALNVCIMAGGFAKYAAPNRTTIVRIENDEQKIIKIDLDDVTKGKILDIPLKPGDRIHVPESWL